MNKNNSNSKPVQITYKTYQSDTRSKSQPTPTKSTAQPPKRKP